MSKPMKIRRITYMDAFLIIILVMLEQLFTCSIQEKSLSRNVFSNKISANRVPFYSIKIHVKEIFFIFFLKMILKVNENTSLILMNNHYSGNYAFEDGSILNFLKSKGTILLKNNTFLNNTIKCYRLTMLFCNMVVKLAVMF